MGLDSPARLIRACFSGWVLGVWGVWGRREAGRGGRLRWRVVSRLRRAGHSEVIRRLTLLPLSRAGGSNRRGSAVSKRGRGR